MPGLAFLSHHHADAAIATEIASTVATFGLEGFLAHRDLDSGTEWREEIQNKLREATLLIAVVSPQFAESEWTDQEVGFALARGIPLLPINAGLPPYGFLGAIQAVRWGDELKEGGWWSGSENHWTRTQLAERQGEIGRALIRRRAFSRADIVDKLLGSGSWDTTRALLATIGPLDDLSPAETLSLARAAAANSEVYKCTQAVIAFPPFLGARRGMLDPDLKAQLVRVRMLEGPEEGFVLESASIEDEDPNQFPH